MFDYFKVGNTLKDEFWYRNASTYAGVTGKVQANFTIKLSKNGVGNQATTGITITEVDATNNPGLYAISVSATTGFASTTGEYTLTIFDTSSPQYAWESSFVVNSDGTGAGTTGAASFTAVLGNGRVTDGSSALTGATVYIKDSLGALYTTVTTTAAGVWGPVWFNKDDTWTAYAFKSGYSVVSFTIVSSGASATGPGTDVALASVTTGSGTTLGELMSYGRRMVRDAVGTKADTDLKGAINDALSMIARERKWPWYERPGTLTLNPNYNTGTLAVTLASATVTLTGGTFPAWVSNDCQLQISGQWHRIASRDSNTQVTLAVAWGEATNLTVTSWNVFQDEYALPADCLRFGRLFPGMAWVYGGEPSSYESVLQAKNGALWNQKFPVAWAIHKNRIVMWPFPSTATNVNFMYWNSPALLVNTSDVADWDPMHLELLNRAIDYQLAVRFGATVGGDANACLARYQQSLAKAVPADKSAARPSNPFSGARSMDPWAGSRLV